MNGSEIVKEAMTYARLAKIYPEGSAIGDSVRRTYSQMVNYLAQEFMNYLPAISELG